MRMVDALIKANKQFDLLIMPGETHATENIWGGYGLDAELRYFKEHLNP
jgi:dipeptidyl aminopeptidase/acylaminoacyl peptidase